MSKIDFSGIVAIAARGFKAMTKIQWELGDELIRTIGPPNREKNGGLFENCSEELARHGYEYSPFTLRNLRDIAHAFPANRRYPALSFGVHSDASTPDTLDIIIEAAPRDQKIVQGYVRSTMRAMALQRQQELKDETERREKARAKAQREREEAEEAARKAKTAAERKTANERATAAAYRERQNKNPPVRADIPLVKPKAKDMPILLARAAFARDLAQAKKSVTDLRKNYAGFMKSFTNNDIENGHDELMAIAESARGFADLLRRGGNGKSSHLSVVSDVG